MTEPATFADTAARRINDIAHMLALAGLHNAAGRAEAARTCLADANHKLSTLRVAFDSQLGPKHLDRVVERSGHKPAQSATLSKASAPGALPATKRRR